MKGWNEEDGQQEKVKYGENEEMEGTDRVGSTGMSIGREWRRRRQGLAQSREV